MASRREHLSSSPPPRPHVSGPRRADARPTSSTLPPDSSDDDLSESSSHDGYDGYSYWDWIARAPKHDSESSTEERSTSHPPCGSSGPAEQESGRKPNWSSIFPHSYARPRTVVEALSAWELPKIRETAENDPPVPDPFEYFCPPGATSDDSCGSPRVTYDSPLLEAIMSHDPILSRKGITLVVDSFMLENRIQQFTCMMRRKHRPEALDTILASIERANHILRQEVSTSEPTTTGILRATLYAVLNDVFAESRLFRKEYRELVSKLVYGDPATTTASRADVTGWHAQEPLNKSGLNLHHARSKVVVEHMLERGLKDSVMIGMTDAFWEDKRGCQVLQIGLGPKGGLMWYGMDGDEDAELRKQISLGLTQLFCNKTSDCVLFNTRHLRVFSRTTRTDLIRVSDVCERTSPRRNVDPKGGRVIRYPKPTPVVVLLAVLATSVDIPPELLPHTKFQRPQKGKEAVREKDRAIRGWEEAPENSLPHLKEATVDSGIIAIAEIACKVPKHKIIPVQAPESMFVRETSSAPSTKAAHEASKKARSGPTKKVEYVIQDIRAESGDVYTIELNVPWKPLFTPGSSSSLRILPKDAARARKTKTLDVQISNIISYGRLFATYGGVWQNANGPGKDIKVVIKFAYPDRYPKRPDVRHEHTFETARDAVLREASLYACELSALQGSIVPHFYGTFINDKGVLATIMERGGEPVLGREEGSIASLSKIVKEQLCETYRQLHQAGVIHRDLCTRHVLKAPGRQAGRKHHYWLIDFEGSIVPPRESLQAFADAEMSRLGKLFYDARKEDGICGWKEPKVQ